MSDFLILYNHCIIVKGAIRSAICDLQRKDLHFIPNAFAELFTDKQYLNVQEILNQLDDEEQEILKEYLTFLEYYELVFPGVQDDLNCFPRLSEEWKFPAHISHCILDSEGQLSYFDTPFLKQLEDQCCNFIQFRFFSEVAYSELNRILTAIENTQVKSIEIILPKRNNDLLFLQKMDELVFKNRKIITLTITGSEETKIYREGEDGAGYIILTTQNIETSSHCGIVGSNLFIVNIEHYTESLVHNTCLNRKISIDVDGNIKNCPSMKDSFGNIKDTTLNEAINKPGFTKYWNITKDNIAKCKDCEFRHVCTDCRAFVENPDDIYAAPLKCGYDPYTCEWEEWSTNPLKQRAIEHYGLRALFPIQ